MKSTVYSQFEDIVMDDVKREGHHLSMPKSKKLYARDAVESSVAVGIESATIELVRIG